MDVPKISDLDLIKTLSTLPPLKTTDPRARTRKIIQTSKSIPILVALDDDPTGTQTCHNISVLTIWDIKTLSAEFKLTKQGSGFFILTNSRALHAHEARNLIIEICQNLQKAAKNAGVNFEIVLRGDSTLRGYFPLEPEAVDESIGQADAWILCPFFLQGGRYTINDVHYVAEGETLIPAGDTPFAKDATFGYRSSNLKDWVVEKSKGKIPQDRIHSLSLEDIRIGGPDRIQQLLMQFKKGSVIIINAAAEEDVDVVVLGILQAAQCGKRFLFRTGAAFVSARLGISPIPPISATTLSLSADVGGLIIAGSYVPKTTSQLECLKTGRGSSLTTIELDVEELLRAQNDSENPITEALIEAEREIVTGQDVLIMTSRKLITGSDEASSLDIGTFVAKALVSFVQRLESRPRYVIAKGGITSSDCATKSLRMKRAIIVGQAAPGIPLWRCDEDSSKWPGLPYIVFPGNVGSKETLLEVVQRFDTHK